MEGDISDMNRPQMYLFGCTLKSDKREYKVDVDDDETEQQLSLKAACLGAEAEDKFHMVEVEALTYDGKATKVPLVVLKPSVLPSMGLGGFEITPPVTLRLLSGSGPVHISGQHFVSVKDSDNEEEEHNTSPVKRPAGLMLEKKASLKKLKMDSDEDSDEDDDDDDDDEDSDENEATPQKTVKKGPETLKKANKSLMKQNGPAATPSGSGVRQQIKTLVPGKDKAQAGPSKSPSLAEIKNKLSTAAKEGKPLPKTEQKFENFVKSSFKISDKQVVKDLWGFVKTLKMEKNHEEVMQPRDDARRRPPKRRRIVHEARGNPPGARFPSCGRLGIQQPGGIIRTDLRP
ncbi:fibroblast growth factor 24 isoform X2 [Phyllopteryx taeniolatus]|uniref:fibroblast growth factor 24 isoform X2 n=1 Tax=Phyllopteryx taeniolatus TaxID=161469 RepID=UPI002AD57591|nr:fibroblast growth factor 24 isoform X2 [Phyllopteryx taeniolatus]